MEGQPYIHLIFSSLGWTLNYTLTYLCFVYIYILLLKLILFLYSFIFGRAGPNYYCHFNFGKLSYLSLVVSAIPHLLLTGRH